MRSDDSVVDVVLFSGGRGSQVLSEELVANPRVRLTIAINGYDDGASTGEVRRLLGDSLGPSDFRKNASRMARALASCAPAEIELLDVRLPRECTPEAGLRALAIAAGEPAAPESVFERGLAQLAGQIAPGARAAIARRLARFRHELGRSGRPFRFSDCSLGNLVFAGGYLEVGRRFNAAVDDYCALLGLRPGLVENVTDGRDAHLIAIDGDGRLLASEAEIVDATRRSRIDEIFLIERPLSPAERERLLGGPAQEIRRFAAERAAHLVPNPRLLERIAAAHLVLYAPGTQHSSLLPSYLTPGLGSAIAANLRAVKLLVTNLQEDAGIADVSALEIVEKAVFYLREKGLREIPTPCLVTHSLINDPTRAETRAAYVPLGGLHSVEDPRLVRIADYEEGATGRHDAEKVIAPFVHSLLERDRRQSLAVLLLDSDRSSKLSQSILEAMRGGLDRAPVSPAFLYWSRESLPREFAASLPCPVENVRTPGESAERSFLRRLREGAYDYALLFESSGMYRGEDIVAVASLLAGGRLDGVWGSRRLSLRDIHESYRLRYRRTPLLGAISYVGSHLLSLAYLVLYGRYVSDTLSGVRAVRARILSEAAIDLGHRRLNQLLLAAVLRHGGELFETPVRFFSMSPEQVKRTSVLDGLRALASILWWRLRPPGAGAAQGVRERAGAPAPGSSPGT